MYDDFDLEADIASCKLFLKVIHLFMYKMKVRVHIRATIFLGYHILLFVVVFVAGEGLV